MIRMVIEIRAVPFGGNEFGAGVNVATDAFRPSDIPQAEGATWAGICLAINEYMHSRGVPDFARCIAFKQRLKSRFDIGEERR